MSLGRHGRHFPRPEEVYQLPKRRTLEDSKYRVTKKSEEGDLSGLKDPVEYSHRYPETKVLTHDSVGLKFRSFCLVGIRKDDLLLVFVVSGAIVRKEIRLLVGR